MPTQIVKPSPSPEAYRTAAELLAKHARDAEFVAAMRADAALEEGDLDTQAFWLAVLRAIDDTQRAEQLPGELDH
jgi:hypothetical protein